jgi:hypothetical protein
MKLVLPNIRHSVDFMTVNDQFGQLVLGGCYGFLVQADHVVSKTLAGHGLLVRLWKDAGQNRLAETFVKRLPAAAATARLMAARTM